MRALFLELDPQWLEDRRRKGLDRRDEVWDGVYHVVPSATATHQRMELALYEALKPVVTPQGLEIFLDFDILDPQKGEQNYRQPDLSVVSPDDVTERAINGHAELVIEIRSKNDESYEKMPFYAERRISEYWIFEPKTRVVEVYVLRRGKYVLQKPNAKGDVFAPRFGLTLRTIDGQKLRITWSGGSAEI